MTRFFRNSAAWLALAVLLGVPSALHAQTAITTTTTDADMAADATTVDLASNTGVTAGTYLYINGEMLVTTTETGASTVWNVRRGDAAGAVSAGAQGGGAAHPSGSRVWVGASGVAGESFIGYDLPVGHTCTVTDFVYFPVINTRANHFFECEGGLWAMWSEPGDPVRVKSFTVRDSFDQGYFRHQDDMTAASVTDDEDNLVHGSPLGVWEYREELGKTTSSFTIADGWLDISADNTIDAEGVEFIFGTIESTTEGVLVAQTQGGCIAVSFDIADISGLDYLNVGWRQNEAFVDAATPNSYTLYNFVGIYNTENGSITHTETGATSDDSGVDWADGDTRALKVCIDNSGVPTAYYSDAYTTSNILTDRPRYNLIPNVNNGTALTSGTQLVPFFQYLAGDNTENSDVRVHWVEITRLPPN